MDVPESIFRAHKRRKVYRRRDEDDEEQAPLATSATSAVTPQEPGLESHSLDETTGTDDVGPGQKPYEATRDRDVTGTAGGAPIVLRQRNPITSKPRRGGIAFSHTVRPSSLRTPSPDTTKSIMISSKEQEQEPKASMLETARSRFAPQTGTAINESGDAHMTAYIDAELERRRRGLISSPALPKPQTQSTSTTSPNHVAQQQPAPLPTAKSKSATEQQQQQQQPPTRQPAATGQIQEVHLPSNPTTNRQQQSQRKEQQRPPRRGRDGKPLPPRKRHRRGSDDLARDALVEAVMRENGLGVYESPSAESAEQSKGGGSGKDSYRGQGTKTEEDADAMVAAQFEREYLESLEAQRRPEQPKMPGPPPGPRVKGEVDLLRGPKLGGSRSARAAMHAAEKEREKNRGK